MTAPSSRSAELAAARQGLDEIDRLVAAGRAAYDESVDRRRAMALCWISVGGATATNAA